MIKSSLTSILFFALVSLSGCIDNTGGGPYSPDPYYGDGYRYGRNDDGYYRNRQWEREHALRHEERELNQERERIEEERRRLEEQRQHQAYTPPPPRNSSNDRCPPGFQPSEQKCSPRERKNGCQDVRTPSGLGCVRR